MFKKLVSNLPFSPSLIGQVGFYANRLRKEESIRRVGLVFTALALIVQSFTVFSPPEAANAASSQDLIRGGVKSKAEFLDHYDKNTNNIRDLLKAVGITRAELKAATKTKGLTINSKTVPYSFGMNAHFSAAQGERKYSFPLENGGTGTVYYQPLWLWDTGNNKKTGSYYEGLVGKSKVAGNFSILFNCANLGLEKKPRIPDCPNGTTGTYPNCKKQKEDKCKVKGKENLSANDKNCVKDKPTPTPTPSPTPSPVVTCTNLDVIKLTSGYQLEASASATGGAKITGYNYTIKRDGKVVDSISSKTSNVYDVAVTHQSAYGAYTASVAVNSSAGDVTSNDCVRSFNIVAPAKCPLNPSLLASDPDCQPCPGDSSLWIRDPKCAPELIFTKSASNLTQNAPDASKTTARPGDTIAYNLNIENAGKAPVTVTPDELLRDVSEYASITSTGGATFDDEAKSLRWGAITLAPGQKESRAFTVQILSDIPTVGQGVSDKTSYDCRIDNTFGNTVSIDVACPIQKEVVEQVVAELPHTGPRENMIFIATIASVVTYFYLRSRQMKQEIRLIRRDFNAGTI